MLFTLQNRAEQDLQFIRATMARVDGQSSVSGLGGLWMGAVALLATLVAADRFVFIDQLIVWMLAGGVGAAAGGLAHLLKARRQQLPWDAWRRFILCLVPSLAFGGVLTLMLLLSAPHFIPTVWLWAYGCGVTAAGTYAVAPVRLMGGCFIVLGCMSVVAPDTWQNALLGMGFGGLHIVFGAWIYRYHGG